MTENVFPILDAFGKCKEIPQNLVEEVRQRFSERVIDKPELYYCEDVERVKSNDWTVKRFLFNYKSRPDVKKAVDNLDRAMQWRKSFGVYELSDKDFAREVYLSGGLIISGTDRNGAQLVIMRGKVAKKIKPWLPSGRRFLVYMIEKVDQLNEGKGLTLLMDCRDTPIKNADIENIRFLNTLLNDYFPALVNATLIYKMPVILEAVYKLVRSWLNEEQVKYVYLVTKKNINEYVSVEQLPDVLFGTSTRPYRIAPADAPTVHQVAEKLGIKADKADKLVKHLEQFYNN